MTSVLLNSVASFNVVLNHGTVGREHTGRSLQEKIVSSGFFLFHFALPTCLH
jgi:hypothetical protein